MRRRTLQQSWFFTLLLLTISSSAIFSQETYQLGNANIANQTINWTGQIVSERDGQGVINAVMRSDNGLNMITDIDGNFNIALEKRTYLFTISALGFEEKQIQLNALSSADLSITLSVESVLIEEILVSGSSEQDKIKEITPGLQRLDAQQLDNQSKFFGEIDILRSLQSISGVSNTGEGASGFNVRGGNTDQNLSLIHI